MPNGRPVDMNGWAPAVPSEVCLLTTDVTIYLLVWGIILVNMKFISMNPHYILTEPLVVTY